MTLVAHGIRNRRRQPQDVQQALAYPFVPAGQQFDHCRLVVAVFRVFRRTKQQVENADVVDQTGQHCVFRLNAAQIAGQHTRDCRNLQGVLPGLPGNMIVGRQIPGPQHLIHGHGQGCCSDNVEPKPLDYGIEVRNLIAGRVVDDRVGQS